MTHILPIKELFQAVEKISLKYGKDEISTHFNIFSVLNLARKEVILHSRFIRELLDPYGNHKKGRHFLEFFFEEIGFGKEKAKQVVSVTKETSNIDILIEAKDWAIIIENKIDHYDTEGQILGYYKKIKEKNIYTDIYILYLHPSGKKPKPISYEDTLKTLNISEDVHKPNHIFCISYRTHITRWIKKSMQKVVPDLHLHTILTQYLHITQQITGQTMNPDLLKEVAEHLKKQPTDFEYALAVQHAVNTLKGDITDAFWKELKEKLAEKYDNIKEWEDRGLYWKIDKIEVKPPIFFWIIMGNGVDGSCIGLGVEEPDGKVNPKIIAQFEEVEVDLINFELNQESRGKYGWLAQYSMKEEYIDFEGFTNQKTRDLIDDKKRETFISNIVNDIDTLLKRYDKKNKQPLN